MAKPSGIKKPQSASAADSPPLQKLCREVLYGIRGLENYDSEESDKLLKFFDEVLEDLEEPSYTGDNQLPLIRELMGTEQEQEEIRMQLEDLAEFAEELRTIPLKDRSDHEQEIDEAIEKAQSVYSKLDSIQEKSSSSVI